MTMKKSWKEKLADSRGLPKIENYTKAKSKNWPAGTYVIPAPIEVDSIMKKVAKGKLITINQIREHLAKKHNTEYSCPIITGIFSWIAAHAADQEAKEGKNPPADLDEKTLRRIK